MAGQVLGGPATSFLSMVMSARKKVILGLLWASGGFLAPGAGAAPHVPASDGEVLERLALKRADPASRAQAALAAALATQPDNLDVALRLARLHIERSRRESDPRELGLAQAALRHWWDAPNPPSAVLLLRATIRQTLHQFAPALEDLRAATAADPRNAQAWLTRATVEQVTGDFAAARRSCEALQPLTLPAVAQVCRSAIDGATGRAGPAFEDLAVMLRTGGNIPPPIRAWAFVLQAELAERLARDDEARSAYRSALAIDPSDAYTQAAYADFLLARGGNSGVLALIPADTRSDPLLLRRVEAAFAAGLPDRQAIAERLRERFEAGRARGDRVHLREEARFALAVEHDPARALALARDNWRVQKEAADLRILFDCAQAAGDTDTLRTLRSWMAQTGFEDAHVRSIAGRTAA